MRSLGVGMLALAGTLAVAPARAETDDERAITLFDKGRKLAREGRCADAVAPLLESIRYAEGVGPLLNLGACYETLGKTASAHRWFVRAQAVAAAHNDRRRDEALQRARSLEKDVPMLLVHIPSSIKASAEVSVDGETWPRDRWDTPAPIDEGTHQIEIVSGPLHSRQSETIVIHGKGDHVEWMARASPTSTPAPAAALAPVPSQAGQAPAARAAAEPSSTQRTLGLASGGVGVAGLVAGAIFGVISISAHSSLVGRCPTYPRCPSSDRHALDDMNANAERAGTVSTIAVVAGAVLLAGGAALFFSAPSPQRSARR